MKIGLSYIYFINKLNGHTFTASQDCLTMPIRKTLRHFDCHVNVSDYKEGSLFGN